MQRGRPGQRELVGLLAIATPVILSGLQLGACHFTQREGFPQARVGVVTAWTADSYMISMRRIGSSVDGAQADCSPSLEESIPENGTLGGPFSYSSSRPITLGKGEKRR